MRSYIKVTVLLFCLFLCPPLWAKNIQKKASIKLIISGLSGDALKNLQSRLNAKKDNIYANESNIVTWNFFHSIAKEAKQALTPYGYFEARTKSTLTKKNNQWLISIRVYPGRRMRFNSVSIHLSGQGKNDPAFKNYLAHIPIRLGNYFNSKNYEKTKSELQNIASNRGYFQTKFITHKLIINLQKYTASVEINFNTGVRSRIGQTHFSPSPFTLALLSRYLAYQPEELYNSALLEETRQNLASSNFFQSVVVIPKPSRKITYYTPIDITFTPQDQVTYTFGAGYGTNTKLRGLATMDLRWLNTSGHSLKALVRGSQRNSEAALSYIIPGRHPATDSYTFNVGVMNLDYERTVGMARNAQSGFSYQTKVADWRLNASLTYLVEKYSLKNYPIKGSNTNTNASVLYPQLLLQRIYGKPNLINPNYGYNILFTVAGGSKNFASKDDFTRSQISTKFLFTITKTHTRILTRVAGGVITIKKIIDLPFSKQFYVGGSQSIRGFEYNSIGPGRDLLVGSFEIQQRVIGNFYVAGFIDAGNVSDEIFKKRLKVGSGPALMYLSPIGAIELSAAKNVSSIDKATGKPNGGWRIHISLGALI